jgi:ubiquinone/menaquinone biosynthesis C-methylase UbiE
VALYNDIILPRLVHLAMRNKKLAPYRERIVPAAHGRVLEVGIGSGLNLPYYGPGVTEIIGLEPSRPLIGMVYQRARTSGKRVSVVEGSAEAIPVETASVETVVMTWTLCSIANARAALAEIRRVMKPGADLLFVEHGRAPDTSVVRWQDRLTPVWRPLAGGCHLNRPIADLLRQAGFNVTDLRTGYMRGGLRPFSFMYEGRARAA